MDRAPLTEHCLTEDAVAALVDGELDSRMFERAEQHLSGCARCMLLVEKVGAVLGREDDRPPTAARPEVQTRYVVDRSCSQLGVTVAAGDGESGPSPTLSDEPLVRGERVGRYEILECIGAGAMGVVYAAHDPELDRRIALKVIRAKAAGPGLEARLQREAKAMARLSHPQVITVHDAGRHGGRLFIAMEFVDGGTLRQWLQAARRPAAEILAVYARAGRGLAQAHSVGIVHRDFKPDNVLVGTDGRVRVTDFGLARAQAAEPSEGTGELGASVAGEGAAVEVSVTKTGAFVGTPVYMAPEQLAGEVVDARADVYSFCVSLYEALYGERPFAGRSLRELIASKGGSGVRAAPPDAKVAPRLRSVLLVGLRARREERYPSMAALLQALERAASRRQLGSTPVRASLAMAAIATLCIGSFVAARPAVRVASARSGVGEPAPLAPTAPLPKEAPPAPSASSAVPSGSEAAGTEGVNTRPPLAARRAPARRSAPPSGAPAPRPGASSAPPPATEETPAAASAVLDEAEFVHERK